mmetsp:Transcript_140128/g.390674  ORF Transcript_140128/g.390674 Transcript_140128/m.390674 type:complete len:261 (-) Transcript_140128:376-1158(-)
MVTMLHARLGTEDVGCTEGLHGARRGGAVGVCGLHQAHAKVLDTCFLQLKRHVVRKQQGNAVTIEQLESAGLVPEEVNHAVRVPVHTDATTAGRQTGPLWYRLVDLHVIRTAAHVEEPIAVVVQPHLQAGLLEPGQHGAQRHRTHAVGAVDRQLWLVALAFPRGAGHQSSVGGNELVLVADEAWDAVARGCVPAPHHKVQLRRGRQSQRPHGRGLQRAHAVAHCQGQTRTARTRVAADDDLCLDAEVSTDYGHKLRDGGG